MRPLRPTNSRLFAAICRSTSRLDLDLNFIVLSLSIFRSFMVLIHNIGCKENQATAVSCSRFNRHKAARENYWLSFYWLRIIRCYFVGCFSGSMSASWFSEFLNFNNEGMLTCSSHTSQSQTVRSEFFYMKLTASRTVWRTYRQEGRQTDRRIESLFPTLMGRMTVLEFVKKNELGLCSKQVRARFPRDVGATAFTLRNPTQNAEVKPVRRGALLRLPFDHC